MRVIRAVLEYATDGDDEASVVQKVYARRQLVRLVLPSVELFDQVFAAEQVARLVHHRAAHVGRDAGQLFHHSEPAEGDERHRVAALMRHR